MDENLENGLNVLAAQIDKDIGLPNFGMSVKPKKPFSLNPQAPRGLSQRFIEIQQPKYSPKR